MNLPKNKNVPIFYSPPMLMRRQWKFHSPQNISAAILLLFLNILKQVPIYFSCLGECCKAVLLLSSRNVSWTMTSAEFPSDE